jgi:hypothetical protein
MAQTSDLLSHPIALDCENTFLLAIKLSNTSWVLAAQVPGLPRRPRRCWRPSKRLCCLCGHRVIAVAG